MGKLIPPATGLEHYPHADDGAETEPVEPPRPGRPCSTRVAGPRARPRGRRTEGLEGFGPSLAEELEEVAQQIETSTDSSGSSE